MILFLKRNVFAILNTAIELGLETLQNVCHTFIDENGPDVLGNESFKNLKEDTLKDIIRRDTFFAPELQIFTAVSEWCKNNPNVETKSVVLLVRLSLLSFEQIFEEVQATGLFDPDTLLNAIKQKSTLPSLPYRKGSWHEENIATKKLGALVTPSGGGSILLDGDTKSYDLNKGYARHKISDDLNLGIIIELGLVTYINHIKLLLLDRDDRSYSYVVDVSVDKIEWKRVVDHRRFLCRSWQFLYFPSIAVRYIKLVGTYNSANKKFFEVVSLEAYCTAEVPNMLNGIPVPTKNVATLELGATVVADGDTKSSESLLNGDYVNYDCSSGYTCHFIGNGSILVQLSQPYIIGSMRLLLLNLGTSKYSYYIETSLNKKDWEVIVDKQKEECRLWQNHEFEPRAMVFIKIVGIKSNVEKTEKDVFACIHFECPSQVLNDNDDNQEAEIIEEPKKQ